MIRALHHPLARSRYTVRMNNRDSSELIKANEAARRLGIHPRTLAKWSDSGHAPGPIRIGPGNRRYYRAADIEALTQDGATE